MAEVASASGSQNNGNNSSELPNSPTPNSPIPNSPTPQSPISNPSHDLPVEMLTAGWRKFWSRREQRPYFFNRLTNESRWEQPNSVNSPENSVPGPERSASDIRLSRSSIDIPSVGDKRPSSALQKSGMSSPPKRPLFNNYSPFWNFEVPTNVTVIERPHCIMPPPHPEVEMLRSQMTVKLRGQYQDLCHTREGIDAPAESFNRWLLERATVNKGDDPLLPSACVPEVSQSMYREVINDIPIKLTKPKYSNDMKRQLLQYAEAAKRLIETRAAASPNSRKLVLYNVEENISWLRKTQSASYSDYLERLTYLKRQCQPHLTEAAKTSVEGICTKMYNLSVECVKRLHEQHWAILKEHNIEKLEHAPQPKGRRQFLCYPLPLAHPTPKLPNIDHTADNDVTFLAYKGDAVRINTSHFCKLEQLYKLSCSDDPRFEKFLARAWCMVKRYRTYFGMKDTSEGTELQGALPLSVFECLHRIFGVAFECFASPLNCYFKQYCSAFPDTDGFFGSRGPVLSFHPLSGSFEANPPFCEELMEAMVDHFENLLEETIEPLSFIIFIPECNDPPTEAHVRLDSSRFKRHSFVLSAEQHEYRHGLQHQIKAQNPEDIHLRSAHGTSVFFIQNDAGYHQWAPTTERVQELKNAARLKQAT